MPCYRPLVGYRSRKVNPKTGKRSIVFNPREGFTELHVNLPCGQCIGCRLEHSRQNAVRATHEASLYKQNCFLTLTYNDENLPRNSFIDKNDPVLFMKRLRKRFGDGIRSYGCAEYGEKFGRPHYHICLFNHDFSDKQLHKITPRGDHLYTSEQLSELWPKGHALIGDLTFESAAYVARYVTKKITGALKEFHYEFIDEHGEILQRPPEQPVCVSRRPGIGKPWLDANHLDVYPRDILVLDRKGKKVKARPPKYYDRRYEIDYPSDFATIRTNRITKARNGCCSYKYCLHTGVNSTHQRLAIREEIQLLKFEKLERKFEKCLRPNTQNISTQSTTLKLKSGTLP